AASNADGEVLVAERRRELLHPRRQTAGPCLDRVRRDGNELRRTGESRLLEQAATPTLPREAQRISVGLCLDDIRRQRNSEPSRDVRENLVTPVGSRSDDDVRLQLDDRLRPGLRGVLAEPVVYDAACMPDVAVDVRIAEHDRLDVTELRRERKRLERDRIVVDQAEEVHETTSPSSRSTSTTRGAASAPPPMISTCVSCSGGTTSLVVTSALACGCGSIRSIDVFFARRRPGTEAERG